MRRGSQNHISDQRILFNAIKIIGLVLITASLTYVLVQLRDLIVCLIFALTLASAISPVAEWGEKHKVPRVVMVTIVYVFVGLVYAVMAVALTPAIKYQTAHLWEHLPSYLARITDWFETVKGGIPGQQAQSIRIEEIFRNAAVRLGHQTLDVGAGLLGLIAHGLLVLFLTAYFVVEATTIWQKLLIWLPSKHRPIAANLIRPLGNRMGGYVRGQLLVSVAVGWFLGAGLWLLRINYALTLGVLAGLLNLVPFVGSALACTFAVVVAANQDLWQVGAVIMLFMFEQWCESNFIVPYLLGRNVELHPLIVLSAILIGATVMGVPGALIAVPVASALQLLAQEFYLKPLNQIETGITISGTPLLNQSGPFSPYPMGDYCKVNPFNLSQLHEQGQTSEIILAPPTQMSPDAMLSKERIR